MPETLYLIDGHAQIFRAYFAIRGGMRSAVTGEPTHAVYGFTGMLLKLLTQFTPHYVAVAMDVHGPTFRDDMFPKYKGTRESTPDDLTAQVPRIWELVKDFGLPSIGLQGLEADDVIATIVERILTNPSYDDVHIRIVSRDKDLEQLLCDRVSMFDIHTDTTIDQEMLLANKGIRPDQVIDYLTLIGDSVDNIPGVNGIGPKTASQLIQQFGSLDGILANLDQIPGKKREYIAGAVDHIPMSKALVTLKRDGDFPFVLEDARVGTLDSDRLIALMQQLGFNKYQEEILKLTGDVRGGLFAEEPQPISKPTAAKPVEIECADTYPVECITTVSALMTLGNALKSGEIFAVKTMTTGEGRSLRLVGLGIANQQKQAYYVPILSAAPHNHLSLGEVLEVLGPILEDETLPKCGHHLKADARVLLLEGVRLRGITFDSYLASSLADPAQPATSLQHLALSRLNRTVTPPDAFVGPGAGAASWEALSHERTATYAGEQAKVAWRLCKSLADDLETLGMGDLMRSCEAPLVSVLAEMEINGIRCVGSELDRQGIELTERAASLRQEVQDVAGCVFHVDSPGQLSMVLFGRLGLQSGKKTKTGHSTDINELERLAALEDPNDPKTSVPRLLIEYRQLTKLIGTYIGNLQASINADTGRIHTTFHQIYTATGRLASQGPNLQNIPVRSEVGRQIRKAFVAPEGHTLICADYSQIELRILAHLSDDVQLLSAFEHNLDIHTAVAAQVFDVPLEAVTREQRSQAKTINFGIIYGVTAFGLARRIGGLDVSAASALISEYKAKFSGIDRFLQQCVQEATETGYVRTLLGRRRNIPEATSTNGKTRSLGERLAINSVVQGSAADLIKLAMVNVQRRIDREDLPLRLLLQIHDELVLETPEEDAPAMAAIVCDEMSRAMSLKVPLECSAGYGYDWFSAK